MLGSPLGHNHPFPDGNKRIAFRSTRAFARRSGAEWVPPDNGGAFIEAVAAGEPDEDVLAAWVRPGRWRSHRIDSLTTAGPTP